MSSTCSANVFLHQLQPVLSTRDRNIAHYCNMSAESSAFVSFTSSFLGHCAQPRSRYHASFHSCDQSRCLEKRRPTHHTSRMLLVDPLQTMPEFLNHIIISCGIGLAGIVGAKATEEVRALTSGDRRAEYFDKLARDVDSVKRRQELATEAGDRDWNDVNVDKFSNLLIAPEEVPEIESYDDLKKFDRLLHESPASKRALRSGASPPSFEHLLPDASEFEMEEEDHGKLS